MIFFLDTNICIYFLKGTHESVRRRLSLHKPEEIKIPSIVMAELLLGAEKSTARTRTIEKIKAFLFPFEIVGFNDAAAVAYSRIRSDLERAGTTIGPNDYIVAATVLSRKGTLVTYNREEFGRVRELPCVDWAGHEP